MTMFTDFLAHPSSYIFEAIVLTGMVVLAYRVIYIINAAYHQAKRQEKAQAETNSSENP